MKCVYEKITIENDSNLPYLQENKNIAINNFNNDPENLIVISDPDICLEKVEQKKIKTISIIKIISIFFGTIAFLSFIMTGIVLYKSGFDFWKLFYPGLAFLTFGILHTIFKEIYINN